MRLPKSARLALFCTLTTQLFAVAYHIAPDGDDARTALQAQNQATPWKTLSKTTRLVLQPGDSVLLARGGVWRENLRFDKAGTPEAPVVLGAYGTGTAPEIRGTDSVVGTWNVDHWTATLAAGTSVRRVFTGTQPLPVARQPVAGWNVVASWENDSTLVSADLDGRDWSGASIHLRTTNWTLETHRVLQSSGSRLVFKGKCLRTPLDSTHFFLSNHPNAPLMPNTWVHDSATGTLTWTGSASTVEASVRGAQLELGSAKYAIIQNLRFFGAATQAIRFSGSNLRIEGCDFEYPALAAVFSLGGKSSQLVGNRFYGSGETTLLLFGSNLSAIDNTVENAGMFSAWGPSGVGSRASGGDGIYIQGDSAVIEHNQVDSIGNTGIFFLGRGSRVIENRVSNACLVTDDAGGIYTWSGNYDSGASAGSVIVRNHVQNVKGAPSGVTRPLEAAHGIYLDDASHEIRIDSNTVSGASSGIFLHNTRHVSARGNVLFDNRVAAVVLGHDAIAGPGDMFDNHFVANLFVGRPGQNADVHHNLGQKQLQPLVSLDANTSCTDQALVARCVQNSTVLWQTTRIATTDPRLGPEVVRNGHFDSAQLGWTAWSDPKWLAVDSGIPCGGGRCLRFTQRAEVAGGSPLASSATKFAVQSGQAWFLSFRARAQRPGQALQPTVRRSGGNFASLGLATSVYLDTAWTPHAFWFRTTATEASTSLDFHNARMDSVYWLDDVSLRSVPESLFTAASAPKLLGNPSARVVNATYGTGSWRDPWGRPIPSNQTLAPWESQVAFAQNPTTKVLPLALALRLFRRGDRWIIEGLTSPARVIDARGRHLGRLIPDPTGHAEWISAPTTSAAWLVTKDQARLLPVR